jgi:hypothetical protein
VQFKFVWVDTDSHRLKHGQAYTYFATTTYNRKNAQGQAITVESDLSNIVTLNTPNTIANDNPSFGATNILARSMRRNNTTGPIAFTVTDTESDNSIGTDDRSLTVSAAVIASTSTQLTPQISWTLGGSGANRTITVTHAGNRTGTVTIQLTVADTQCSSRTGASTFPPTNCTAGTATYTFTVTITN